MELSDQERQLIQRLRKQERNWRWGRWAALFVGLFSIGLSVAGLVWVVPFLHWASEKKEGEVPAAFMLAFLHPPILAFGFIGVLALYSAIRDWRGNSTRILLLRLFDSRGTEK